MILSYRYNNNIIIAALYAEAARRDDGETKQLYYYYNILNTERFKNNTFSKIEISEKKFIRGILWFE